jgi:23S rRNA (uridine2552-2'-O)-methyltransferase
LKKNKISKNWIRKQKKDIFVRQSKIEGYRSRAVYKLIEINKKFKILKNGISITDLGAAPGSWSQYISRSFKNIKLLSIDLRDMEEVNNTHQIIGDFNDIESKNKIKDYFKSKIDVVLSDMAENTTGNKNLDVISTSELCKEAMFFAKDILKENGTFVCKIFMGSTFKEIMTESKLIFKQIKVFKPSSSRKDSKESFLICKFLR